MWVQTQEEAAQRELSNIHRQQQEAEAHASNLAVVTQMNPEEQTWQGAPPSLHLGLSCTEILICLCYFFNRVHIV
jgi:hypothetical protein